MILFDEHVKRNHVISAPDMKVSHSTKTTVRPLTIPWIQWILPHNLTKKAKSPFHAPFLTRSSGVEDIKTECISFIQLSINKRLSSSRMTQNPFLFHLTSTLMFNPGIMLQDFSYSEYTVGKISSQRMPAFHQFKYELIWDLSSILSMTYLATSNKMSRFAKMTPPHCS